MLPSKPGAPTAMALDHSAREVTGFIFGTVATECAVQGANAMIYV